MNRSSMSLVSDRTLDRMLRFSRLALIGPTVALGMGPFPATVQAQTAPLGADCPAGTTRSSQNLVVNSNYATLAGGAEPFVSPVASFTSSLPYRGDGIYPDDPGANGVGPRDATGSGPRGGISIQTGSINYLGGSILADPFPGDPGRGAAASNNFLYSNPNASVTNPFTPQSAFPGPTIWRQTVAVAPNTTYNFLAYFNNLLRDDPAVPGANPEIQLQLARAGDPPVDLGPQVSVPRTVPNGIANEWLPVQFSFRTGPTDTSVTLSFIDRADTLLGDDFGHTAIGVSQCISNLGVAKGAGAPVNNGNGTFTVPYTLTVRNYGVDPITALQVTDDLATTFANAAGFSISNLQSPTLQINSGFDGKGNQQLLTGTDTLAPNTSASITFNVTLTPGIGSGGFGVFNNTAIATGNAGTIPVRDTSTDGTNPDPNGNSKPDDPGEDAPTPVTLPNIPPPPPPGEANLRLVKRITAVTRGGTPLSGVNFGTLTNDPADPGDDASGWSQFPPVGMIQLGAGTPLQSGDEVEYTIYFLSDGSLPAREINFCDPISLGTTFVRDRFSAGSGISINRSGATTSVTNAADLDSGTFFSPLAPLPVGNVCPEQTNPNGAVIVQLGDISNTGSNFGFVRFQVRVD